MIEAPKIIRTTAQKTAVIPITVPKNEIITVMGPGLQELAAALSSQGVKPTGPWFSHHVRLDENIFEFEISMPVAETIKPAGRVKASELPAATVARTIYRGPYEGLGSAWSEFRAWMSANGKSVAPNIWEVYLSGPESSKNPGDWYTELNQPIIE
jgi:effector-binding domain-containing protein